MWNAIASYPQPRNETVLTYLPGSPERAALKEHLQRQAHQHIEVPLFIDGKEVRTSQTVMISSPHMHHHRLGALHWEARAAVLLKAADLLAGPWRMRLNAATMLGQSKTCHQAEIDAACELIDFLRFNVAFYEQLLREQPRSSPGMWNRLEHRPLEGFVFAVSPFNFTAIAGNLPSCVALCGNTVVWKPASTAVYSAHFIMKIFREAGL